MEEMTHEDYLEGQAKQADARLGQEFVVDGPIPPEAYIGAPTYNVDFQREHALRFAVETFSGQGVTTLDIIARAQVFYDFMVGKPA